MRTESTTCDQAGSNGTTAGRPAAVSHPEFTVLLARQRSGTNALRSVLGTHPEIHCFDEVFKVATQLEVDVPAKFGNYFAFLEQYCAGDVRKMFPDRYAETFAAYLVHLRGLTPKSRIVIDIKYDSTHHVTGVWRELAKPTLFGLLESQGIGVLHLTRRNLLRCLLSNMKSWQSKRYHAPRGAARRDLQIKLGPEWALGRMQQWADEDRLVAESFQGYEFYKRVEYTDLFPDSSGAVDETALDDIAKWFGVPDGFTHESPLEKISYLPLEETIENFAALSAVLRGTPFEACLDDEPSYRRSRYSNAEGDAGLSGRSSNESRYETNADSRLTVRERLTADRTYYVRTDGSDSNDGLTDSADGALRTIQRAVWLVSSTIDMDGCQCTIQVSPGAYTESVSLGRYVGARPPIIRGDTTTPSAVEVIGVGSSPCFVNHLTGAHWEIEGFKLTHGTSNTVIARGGIIGLHQIEFGAADGFHMYADLCGHIVLTGDYAISGGAAAHAVADSTGSIIRTAGTTVTMTNTPAFAKAFAFAQRCGLVQANGMTFVGSAVGPRFWAATNAVIDTGGGADYLPGDKAGKTASGGQYV